MTREELMEIIPHRDDMLLVDETHLEGDRAYGSYTVRGDEWFLNGHFPGNPVVPGVILCEIMAQSSCILLAEELKGKTPMFAGISDARFKAPVRPGDTIETECYITKAKPPFYFATGKGQVDGKLCVKADFSFAIIKPE